MSQSSKAKVAFGLLLGSIPFTLGVAVSVGAQLLGPIPGRPQDLPRPTGGVCIGDCNELHWTFETSGRPDLQGWTGEGTAFADAAGVHQPTFGSNVTLRRALAVSDADRALRSLRSLTGLGGDYWETPFHTGYEGDYWLGTYESRPSARQPLGSVASDAARGSMSSHSFVLKKKKIAFLASGTCGTNVSVVLEERVTKRAVLDDCATERARAESVDQRAAACRTTTAECTALLREGIAAHQAWEACRTNPRVLRVEAIASPAWAQTRVPRGHAPRPPHAAIYYEPRFTPTAPYCGETMKRIAWDVAPLLSRPDEVTYRLRLVDLAIDGHISLDDVWVTDRESVPEPKTPVWGFADLHTHPAAHLGYSGLLVSGTPAGTNPGAWPRGDSAFWSDLRSSPSPYGLHRNSWAAGQALELFTRGGRDVDPGGLKRPYGDFARSSEERLGRGRSTRVVRRAIGSWLNASAQAMHINWLHRAYEGGMRLLVADAVNSRGLAWLMVSEPGVVPTRDPEVIRRHTRYMTELARANSSWMEIVLSPSHARRVIAEGKLAIVLGAEVDSWGDCDNVTTVIREGGDNTPPMTTRCDRSRLPGELRALIDIGQRKINPIHLADNAFGGHAVYSDLFNSGNQWLNRGDTADLCADSRMPASLCGSSPARDDPDPAHSLPTVGLPSESGAPMVMAPGNCECVRGGPLIVQCPVSPGLGNVACSHDFYIRYFGYARVRDGTKNLGVSPLPEHPEVIPGFRFGRQAYLTMSRNPFPFEAGGCPGGRLCQNPVRDLRVYVPSYGDRKPDINAVGLTPLGRVFLRDLMKHGMLIDVQHMSDKAVNEVLGLADPGLDTIPGGGVAIAAHGNARCGRLSVVAMKNDQACRDDFYPVMSSHGVFRDVTVPDRRNENTRSKEQLERIYQTGGVVGVGTVGGTASFEQNLRFARNLLGEVGIASGTDLNGGDAGAPPRIIQWACYKTRPAEGSKMVKYAGAGDVSYSWKKCGTPTPEQVTFGLDTAPPLKAMEIPMRDAAPLDINVDGMANVGMYPDYLQEVRIAAQAATGRRDDLTPVFSSAERTIQLWEKACRVAQRLDPSASDAACKCDPGAPALRRYCPAQSPGMAP